MVKLFKLQQILVSKKKCIFVAIRGIRKMSQYPPPNNGIFPGPSSRGVPVNGLPTLPGIPAGWQESIYRNFVNPPYMYQAYYPHAYWQYRPQFYPPVNLRENTFRRTPQEPKETPKIEKRMWTQINEETSKEGFDFSLLSYNVLAQRLLQEHYSLYKKHDSKSLKWDVRWKNLWDEIYNLSPDIICFQEVQFDHVESHFDRLKTLGYTGIYKQKTGKRVDGVAIYYKTQKLSLVQHSGIEFFHENVEILNRDNVGLIAKFAPKSNEKKEFLVATTHLLFNPRRENVRLAQMQVFLTEIEEMSYVMSTNSYIPVILTGDFNSTPNDEVYQFITRSFVRYDGLLKAHGFQGKELLPKSLEITDNCEKVSNIIKRGIGGNMNFNTGILKHNFAFKSVYNHGRHEKIEVTSFQDKWVTVDYIFYSGEKIDARIEEKDLQLLARYRLPTCNEVLKYTLPNSELGSDHFSLMTKLRLKF